MQYCYDITGIKDLPVEVLKEYVQSIYMQKKFGDYAFSKEDIPPFVVIHSKSDDRVCISLIGTKKSVIEKIEYIHKNLSASDLKFRGVILSQPYVFGVQESNWWEDERDTQPPQERWRTLSHRGPYFTHLMEPYEPLGVRLIYDKKAYALNPKEERVLGFYAKRKISEEKGGVTELLTKDEVFNKNYFNDLKSYLTAEHLKTFVDFDKFDFSDIMKKIIDKAEHELAARDTEAKRLKKQKIEERKLEYGYANLDGVREKVGNFIVEPASIFYGRGKNPRRGKIKPDIYPEDVSINISLSDKPPPAPQGHKWGEIITDRSSTWLAKWDDPITGSKKYILFSMEGKIKGMSDLAKYEKARKLNKYIDQIRAKYREDLYSDDEIKKQLGTVLFLIDNFGIRVGNEKDEDEADTVGATTLRVNHVNTNTENHIVFDFLGKDSVRFFKDLTVPSIVYKNIRSFQSNKKPDGDLFDRISSDDINAYLKQIDKSFSAKVFRTRLASTIMFNALKEVKIPKGSTKTRTKELFNNANSKVAEILNHTRNVPKKTEENVQKFRDQLSELRKGKRPDLEKISLLEEKIQSMSNVMNVAITTSLNNYIDPRLIVSWSKSENVPIDHIYSGTLMRKFNWAILSTSEKWNYLSSPPIGNPELEPSDEPQRRVKGLRYPLYAKEHIIPSRKDKKTYMLKKVDQAEDEKKIATILKKRSKEKKQEKTEEKKSRELEKLEREKEERQKYHKGVPVKLLSQLANIRRFEWKKEQEKFGKRKMFDDPNETEYQGLPIEEWKHYDKLSHYCRVKPFKKAYLKMVPFHVIEWLLPYAYEARQSGIKTEFGDEIIRYFVEVKKL